MSNIRLVTESVVDALVAARPRLDEAVRTAGMPKDVGVILPYFTPNLDVGSYPALMVQPMSESWEWLAMPVIGLQRCELSVWGFVHWDEPGVASAAVGFLAEAVARTLNIRNRAIPLPSGHELWFNDTTPVRRVEYGASTLTTGFVRGFQLVWVGDVCEQLREEP
jgi:hypothetical protein